MPGAIGNISLYNFHFALSALRGSTTPPGPMAQAFTFRAFSAKTKKEPTDIREALTGDLRRRRERVTGSQSPPALDFRLGARRCCRFGPLLLHELAHGGNMTGRATIRPGFEALSGTFQVRE